MAWLVVWSFALGFIEKRYAEVNMACHCHLNILTTAAALQLPRGRREQTTDSNVHKIVKMVEFLITIFEFTMKNALRYRPDPRGIG